MIRGTHRAAVMACVVAACACWTQPSAAQVALDWSAPRGCPDSAYVAQQLAKARSEAAARALEVRARVQRVGRASFVLRLVLRADDLRAERRLEGSSCTSVTDAAIWLIAVALSPGAPAPSDPSAAPATPNQDAAPAPDAESTRAAPSLPTERDRVESAAAPAAPAARATTPGAATVYPARRAPWRRDWATLPRWWRVGGFAGVWSAALPAPQLSLGGRLGFGISVLYAELRASAELARGQRLADGTEARLATQDAGLALCAQWGDRVRAGPCATATVLRTTAGSRGVPEASDRALPWTAGGVAVVLGWRPFRRVELMLETGVQLPLSARPRFTVEGVGEVAVAAPVNVYARVGLGFRSTDVRREP